MSQDQPHSRITNLTDFNVGVNDEAVNPETRDLRFHFVVLQAFVFKMCLAPEKLLHRYN